MLKYLKVTTIILIWFSSFAIAIWLLNENFVFSGMLTIEYIPGKGNSKSLIFTDEQNNVIEENGQEYLILTKNVADFQTRIPRAFAKANVTFTYQNPTDVSQLNLGILNSDGYFEFKPLATENSIINQLAATNKISDNEKSSWHRLDENGITLWQRNKKFTKISDFFVQPPSTNKIVTYNLDFKSNTYIKNYQNSTSSELDIPLKCPITFYTYIKNKPLDFKFAIIDLNQRKGGDSVKVTLKKEGVTISQVSLNDDNITDNSGVITPVNFLQLKKDGLSEGLYSIEIKASHDIVIQEIISGQGELFFENLITIYNTDKVNNLNLYTNGQKITFYPTSENGLQEISLNGKTKNLNKVEKNVKLSSKSKTNNIVLNSGNIRLKTDGYFSFSPEYIDNRILQPVKQIDDVIDINDYDYIIAKYKLPEKNNTDRTATQIFNTIENYFDSKKGTVKFRLSIPELEEKHKLLKIEKISIVFEKIPLTLGNFFPRLKNFLKF